MTPSFRLLERIYPQFTTAIDAGHGFEVAAAFREHAKSLDSA